MHNAGPPVFSKKISEINVELGEIRIFKFPPMTDPDKEDRASFVRLILGPA